MSNRSMGFRLSFALHAMILLLLALLSGSLSHLSKPVVIDFTIEGQEDGPRDVPRAASVLRKPEAADRERVTSLPEKTETHPEKEVIQTESTALSEKTESHSEKEVIQTENTEPYTSESQVQVPVQAAAPKQEASTRSVETRISAPPAVAATGTSVEGKKKKYLLDHFAYIKDIIMKNLSYPQTARKMGWSGKVTLCFTVSETGYAEDIRVLKTSGVGLLDNNAIETVKKVCPFPKPPVRAELIVPIVYRLQNLD